MSSIIKKYKNKTFIVKVQTTIVSSDGVQKLLLYNENREIWYEGNLSDEIAGIMRGRKKVYFRARFKGTLVDLIQECEPQDW